jgi:hypothetical protein
MLGTSVNVAYAGFDASMQYLATTSSARSTLQVPNVPGYLSISFSERLLVLSNLTI